MTPARSLEANVNQMLIAIAVATSAVAAQEVEITVTADNPDPGSLPTLGLWMWEDRPMVAATFPNLPDFTCDSWCYESETDFLGAEPGEGGALVLRHRLRQYPKVTLVTTVTPLPGAVEFLARLEVADDAGELPDYLITPNLCWQLRRAPSFASAPDPFPEFVKRCFIFTREGLTFLDKTERLPIPVRAADDPFNNPPWVQMYRGEWQDIPEVGPTSWAAFSPTRYTATVIGAVSRDGKWLTAIADNGAWQMCQAWHDCMHNNPDWEPQDGPHEDRVWRLRVYAMENDPQALLDRVAEDFLSAIHTRR